MRYFASTNARGIPIARYIQPERPENTSVEIAPTAAKRVLADDVAKSIFFEWCPIKARDDL